MIPYLFGGLFVVLLGLSFLISALDHPDNDEDPQ